ncbi:MAG: hypothetical protein HUU20_12180 [Pirellulales bacterium]|nr:hypothetical protein [Pirellulales bacterium]
MAAVALADPNASVQSGRDALDHLWGYPWYDRGADDLERIDVSPPWGLDWLPDWQGFSLGRWPNNLMEWLAWIGVAVALALLVWLLLRTYQARRRAGASGVRPSAPDSDPADQRRRVDALPLPGARHELDFLAEAERYYHDGQYAAAIVCLFSYQLLQLDQRHWIRLTKGKTNRQYLRELGPRTALGRILEQTMVAFEDVFFGHCAMDRARFESCWSRVSEFESLAAEGRG